MEVAKSHSTGDDVVLQRTAAGQRALVFGAVLDDGPERHLLAMLTGYTPLRVYMRLGVDEEVARTAARRLVAMNLAANTPQRPLFGSAST